MPKLTLNCSPQNTSLRPFTLLPYNQLRHRHRHRSTTVRIKSKSKSPSPSSPSPSFHRNYSLTYSPSYRFHLFSESDRLQNHFVP
ncbi:unnamed protein product [Trifolium pratense]|uniref:Uncharacterized protein n=1 Tax=Trifolium pratense TaxID=57577 RepID=A0ACB0LDR4_TRIPR|nr:unnamed protein product [Trifolium pratense]